MDATRRSEFEKKAFHVVERLLDVPVDVSFFLDAVKCIEPRHYDDVIEERSILNLCGYPLCRQPLGNVSRQKYHISLANKKVYDLTQRKKFCSNTCFKCSNYYASQVPTTPVWARDRSDFPQVKLLPMDDRVDERGTADTQSADKGSIAGENRTDASLTQVSEQRTEEKKNPAGQAETLRQTIPVAAQMQTDRTPTVSGATSTELPINQMSSSMVEIVNEVLSSWCTADTILFLTNPLPSRLHTETSGVRRQEAGAASSPASSMSGGKSKAGKMEGFKRKGGSGSKVKREGLSVVKSKMETSEEEMMEKLRRFQVNADSGRFVDDLAVTESRGVGDGDGEMSVPVPAMKELDGDSVVVKENFPVESQDLDPVLPLIDSQSQVAIRQRIVLDQLNKAYRPLLSQSNLSIGGFSGDLKNLVQTFRLHSSNITLKPKQWKVVSIVLLHSLNSSAVVDNATLSECLASHSLCKRLHQCLINSEVTDEDMASLISIFGVEFVSEQDNSSPHAMNNCSVLDLDH